MGDENVDILRVVYFVSIFLLSFPVIRFTARLFAYIVTTRASALLYRGNRCAPPSRVYRHSNV